MNRPLSAFAVLVALSTGVATAQVSSYSFSSEIGAWQPLAGSGTPLGMPNMPPAFDHYDDNSFVQQGTQVLIGYASTGNGWPIGFTFHFNGQAYDRVGLSIEGWLAFGKSSDGNSAVFVPIGSTAYVPLSSALPAGMEAGMRNRIAGFAADLRAQGAGGTWPLQIATMGQAPNRRFVAEWNVMRTGGAPAADWLSFQVQLHEGGGDPAQQTVQVVYGNMTHSTALSGQVGLGGTSPADFNNRSVTVSPYDWQQDQAGTVNTASCRLPATIDRIPAGLTFTWAPAGCMVSGIAVNELAMAGGVVQGTLVWAALSGATSYDYLITTGGPGADVVASGSGLTGTSAPLAGLPAGVDLFAYVKADCAGADEWGGGFLFSTIGITEVQCGQPPHQDNYCYTNLEQRTWSYTSSSGEPMRMFIHAGTIHSGDLLTVHDGNSTAAPLLFSSATGDIAGQMITSTGPSITMKLVSDANGSCASQDFIPAMEWEVGCLDCDPVLANYQVLDDCPNGQFSVQVSIFGLGDAASVAITNNGAAPVVNASSPGTYTVGPFPIGTPVVVVAENAYNAYCSSSSGPVINGTCPLVDCGPTDHAYCYTNNDASAFAYQSEDNERIGIRFRSGSLASFDMIHIYDGLDPFMSAPLFSGGQGSDLTNLMVVTSAANADHALLLVVEANGSNSCGTGQALPWDYVVACYDGCTPPSVTFTTIPDCDQGSFRIAVDVASMGSAASLDIVNDGGAAPLTATAAGTYLTGPFPIGQYVMVEVAGTNVLCAVNSTLLTESCGVGVSEMAMEEIGIFPNPGDGDVQLVMPKGFGWHGQLEVKDLAGRTMARQVLTGKDGRGARFDLGHLPAGSYLLTVTNGSKRVQGRLVIVH